MKQVHNSCALQTCCLTNACWSLKLLIVITLHGEENEGEDEKEEGNEEEEDPEKGTSSVLKVEKPMLLHEGQEIGFQMCDVVRFFHKLSTFGSLKVTNHEKELRIELSILLEDVTGTEKECRNWRDVR